MTDFFNYTRTIDMVNDTYWKRLPWVDDDITRNKNLLTHCHWGQLKLFYSELEFFIECIKRGYKLSNSVVVYPGSAPGTHINFLIKLFPELYWILIDPAKFNLRDSSNVSIITGKPNGFYTDESYKIIINHPFVTNNGNKRDIFYISDIRIETDETSIFKDMISQQKWLLQIKASMSMLKCRIPYNIVDENNNHLDWSYDINDIKKYIKLPFSKKLINNKEFNKNKFLYLKGDIYTQIYPPITSAETRLIIDKNRDNFTMTQYDIIAYEEKLNYYNSIIRKFTDFNNFKKTSEHIYSYNNTYENASEFYLALSYFKYYKNIEKPTFKNILNFMLNIYGFHYRLSDDTFNGITYTRSLTICPYRSLFKEAKKWNNYSNFKKKILSDFKNKTIDNQDGLISLYLNSLNKFKETVKFLNSRKIQFIKKIKSKDLLLDTEKYIQQIKYIDDDLTNINRYFETFIKYFTDFSVDFKLTNLNEVINKNNKI